MYEFPSSLPLGGLGLSGIWTDHAQEATAGTDAQMELGFQADDVYLVLGGRGTLAVSVNGVHTKTITVSGIPRLYTLVPLRTEPDRGAPAQGVPRGPGIRLHIRLNVRPDQG